MVQQCGFLRPEAEPWFLLPADQAMVVHAAHLLADEHLFDKNALQRLDPLAAQWLNGFDDQLFQIKNEIEAKVYAYEMLYGMLAA